MNQDPIRPGHLYKTAAAELKRLVGPPGFEPGTSCTPNTGPISLGSVAEGVFYGLYGFGASASARCRWRWIGFLAHICAQSAFVGGPNALNGFIDSAGMHQLLPSSSAGFGANAKQCSELLPAATDCYPLLAPSGQHRAELVSEGLCIAKIMLWAIIWSLPGAGVRLEPTLPSMASHSRKQNPFFWTRAPA